MAEHGVAPLRERRMSEVFLDIDTTVTPLFGEQEGARPGPNPRYHGRPSYHPILARIAQSGTIVGARLRPGDTGLGELDVEDVEQWLDRTRDAAGKAALITTRIDAGGDCAALLRAIDGKGAWFLVKMKQTPNLVGAVWATKRWTTVDRDALGKPTRQVAEIDFEREGWPPGQWRVFAVRTNERRSGNQSCLWQDLDFSVHVFATNDHAHDADELARRYDDRAGIETVIAELKGGFGIGKTSTDCFDANEAAFLLKVLAFNLLRRWVHARHRPLASWRTPWLRRICVQVPGPAAALRRSMGAAARAASDAAREPRAARIRIRGKGGSVPEDRYERACRAWRSRRRRQLHAAPLMPSGGAKSRLRPARSTRKCVDPGPEKVSADTSVGQILSGPSLVVKRAGGSSLAPTAGREPLSAFPSCHGARPPQSSRDPRFPRGPSHGTGLVGHTSGSSGPRRSGHHSP